MILARCCRVVTMKVQAHKGTRYGTVDASKGCGAKPKRPSKEPCKCVHGVVVAQAICVARACFMMYVILCFKFYMSISTSTCRARKNQKQVMSGYAWLSRTKKAYAERCVAVRSLEHQMTPDFI